MPLPLDDRDSTGESSSDSSLHLGLDEFLDSELARGDSIRSDPTRLDGGNRFATPAKLLQPLPAGTEFAQRYRVLRCLGRGGFSDVYLCIDSALDRRVAVKRSLISEADTEFALHEAKTVASLDHPSIVQIFDVVRDERFGLLIVMQYVEGRTLRAVLKKEKLSVWRCVNIVRNVALAAAHAHQRRIVHRDIKPANILFDSYGNPLLSDFGLAWKQSFGKMSAGISGTLRYMSPEQMRGELHRIDPRSDIFTLGIVLYEMLTDRLPFDGKTTREIAKATIGVEPTSLRALNSEVPIELDRACRRAMRKSVKDRYATMLDFAADLQVIAEQNLDTSRDASEPRTLPRPSFDSHMLESGSGQRTLLVPRGLEPFDRADAEGFLPLVAGPRSPNGLPESILTWKDWIEARATDEHNRLAVLYGPPGSGKTSLVQAGVIPNIEQDIHVISIECRPGNLAKRISRELVSEVGLAATDESLTELLMRLRIEETVESRHTKIVVVLDQFEQWAQRASESQFQLIASALRQCDGERLQAIVVASDEHWRSVTKLAELVEVPLLEGKNSFAMELLSPPQAMRILESMGRAYGTLPSASQSNDSSDAHSYFDGGLERIVNALGPGRGARILPIQLAMFAQMASLHHWSPSILEETGGIQRLYLNYFEEFFESASAPRNHRRSLNAASEILSALLPAVDQSVREHVLTVKEISAAISRGIEQDQVSTAFRLLADDLRAIVSVQGNNDDDASPDKDAIAYRISSDTLTTPIRQWTQQVTKSTVEGRAVAQFRELAAMWQRRPHQRFFPSLPDYITTKSAVRAIALTQPQRDFLRAADAFYVRRGVLFGCLLGLLAAVVAFGWVQRRQSLRQQTLAANAKLDALISGEIESVPALLDELEAMEYRSLILSIANRWALTGGAQAKSRCQLLLARLDRSYQAQMFLDLSVFEPELSAEIIGIARRNPACIRYLEQCMEARSNPVATVRASIVAAYLGELHPMRGVLLYDIDPNLYNIAIGETATWRADPQPLLEMLEDVSLDINYLGLIALGGFPAKALHEVDGLEPLLRGLIASDSAALHSAARWVYERAGLDEARLEPSPTAQWQTSTFGLDLIRIPLRPAPSLLDEDAYPHSNKHVWMTATAVPQGLVAQFSDELRKTGQAGLTGEFATQVGPNLPARRLFPADIARLCNWLSRLDGLEPAYDVNGESTSPTADQWKIEFRRDRSGYRLANVHELRSAVSQHGELLPSLESIQKQFHASGRPFVTDTRINDRSVTAVFPNRIGVFCNDSVARIVANDEDFGMCVSVTSFGDLTAMQFGREQFEYTPQRIFIVRD